MNEVNSYASRSFSIRTAGDGTFLLEEGQHLKVNKTFFKIKNKKKRILKNNQCYIKIYTETFLYP